MLSLKNFIAGHPARFKTTMAIRKYTWDSSSLFPKMIYGTAWKKEATTALVKQAIRAGFRSIDTACQPRHYREDLVGNAISELIAEGHIRRSELFIQTKYTPVGGQDPDTIPYDPTQPTVSQVTQSIDKSLDNLKTTYIDSVLLHSPLDSHNETMEAWKRLESYQQAGIIRYIGVSNFDEQRFSMLYEAARVKPTFLQNRFYATTNYEFGLREYCSKRKVHFQSFWTLTGNPHILTDSTTKSIANSLHKTPAQIFLRFVLQEGIIPLTGTKTHMEEDLEVLEFVLSEEHMKAIRQLLVRTAKGHPQQ